jgi:hypothetical protein
MSAASKNIRKHVSSKYIMSAARNLNLTRLWIYAAREIDVEIERVDKVEEYLAHSSSGVSTCTFVPVKQVKQVK